MTPELHSLAGAYTLDALDETERAAFETHLVECVDCAEEVRSLRAAAAELSQVAAVAPPQQLRGDVLTAIRTVRPLPPVVDNVIALRRARAGRSVWQVLAAACALVAIVLAGWGYQQHQDARRQTTAAARSIDSLLNASDAKVITGGLGTGQATLVYSRSQLRIALVGHNVPSPAAGKTYQLWMIEPNGSGNTFISAGTFAPDAHGDVRAVASSAELARTAVMGISLEPAGGSAQPTDVLATMKI